MVRLVNKDQGRTWKEAAMAQFETLPRHLFQGIEENHKIFVRIAGLWAEI
jgi:hypothetical protein